MQDTRSDTVFREALQLIAEGVAEAVGFEIAAISLVREDGQLEFAAFVGDVPDRAAVLRTTAPAAALVEHIAEGETWGDFKFVPHERVTIPAEYVAYTPNGTGASDDPDAWHPEDSLSAPIFDDDGLLRALLQVDQPIDGRRPSAEKRAKLQRYAAQTRRAVLTAVEGEEAGRRLTLAARARRVVRNATGQLGAQGVLDAAGPALIEAFEIDRLWIESMAGEEYVQAFWLGDDSPWRPSERLLKAFREQAQEHWANHAAAVIQADDPLPSGLAEQEERAFRGALERAGSAGALMVPLGAGTTCVGYLLMAADHRDDPWTAAERETVLDIGHDLGRALLTARVFAREREVAEKLRRLDEYRRTFVRTLAHELKNPLAAIFGHTAVTGQLPLSPQAAESMTAIRGAADRMRIVIDDLLVLSGLNDPEFPLVPAEVDLAEVVHDVVDANLVVASQQSLELDVATPDVLWVRGSAAELERALTNLVGNALSYTPAGGRVLVHLATEGDEVRLTVRDDGPGILPADRQRIFDDFYRGSNPATRGIPGSGLGLSIVAHVAARHGGRVEVESEPGDGAEFTIVLPARSR